MKRMTKTIIISLIAVLGVVVYLVFTNDFFMHRKFVSLLMQIEHQEFIEHITVTSSRTNPTVKIQVTLISDLNEEQIHTVGVELMDIFDLNIYPGVDNSLMGKVNPGDVTFYLKSQNGTEELQKTYARDAITENGKLIGYEWCFTDPITGKTSVNSIPYMQ